MKEVNGENPQNARIKISYAKKKPTVKFSYPVKKKDSQTRGDMMLPVLAGWCIITLIILIGITIGDSVMNLEEKDNQTYLEKFVRCALLYPNETLTNYTNVKDNLCKPEKERESFFREYLMLICLGFVFLGWVLTYFPFKKRWDSLYPDFQASSANKKYHKFNTNEVRESDGKYYVELPIFNNVICDWNATKDFSEYMEEFEIEEYKFEYYEGPKKKKKSKDKSQKGKKNEIIWYARWYFKKKPEKGFIEVIYK